MRNGVFVGSSDRSGNINCSIGSYESARQTSRDHILHSASLCSKDALLRWNHPYGDVNNYTFKIEILQRKPWQSLTPQQFIKQYTSDSQVGILLKFKNGAAATYLPEVWKTSFPDGTTGEQLLTSLSQKAGMPANAWESVGTRVKCIHQFVINCTL